MRTLLDEDEREEEIVPSTVRNLPPPAPVPVPKHRSSRAAAENSKGHDAASKQQPRRTNSKSAFDRQVVSNERGISADAKQGQ
jgi:hypothetical protein